MSEHTSTELRDAVIGNHPEDELLIEAPTPELELPAAAATGETTKEQNNELVASELAQVIEAAGTDNDKAKEDLSVYIHDIMSNGESSQLVECSVIFELLAKTQHYKLCNEIADASSNLIDELTRENNGSSNSKLTLCDDIKDRMKGATEISGLIPDHKEYVGDQLVKNHQSAMKAYEGLRDRASTRRDDIEKLEELNNIKSLDEIEQNYQDRLDEYGRRNLEISGAIAASKEENPKSDDLLSVIDPEVVDHVVDSLVEAVNTAKDNNEPATSLIIDIINDKDFNIDAILSDCGQFIDEYRSRRLQFRLSANDAVVKAKGSINRFRSDANYATQEGNSLDAATRFYESQAKQLDEVIKSIDSAKEKIEEDRGTAENQLSARAANILRAPQVKAEVSSNAKQFNADFTLQ